MKTNEEDSDEEEAKELKVCYSVGSYGVFPITFYLLNGRVNYHPQEHGEHGPFASLEKAVRDAAGGIGTSDGGFHDSLKDAEEHAQWMREQGFGVE